MTYKVPTAEEKEILRKNGMDPEVFMVKYHYEDLLHVFNLDTRNDIRIHLI